MTPNPPMKWVEDLQKRRLFGRASMSVRIVDPVVVYPETLSNHAFIRVNSPPQSTYGSIPNMNESIQEMMMVRYPLFIDVSIPFLTKMNGKQPVIAVTRKLISRGVNAESKPLYIEIITDMNMNKALMSNALPIFVDIALTFMSDGLNFAMQIY